MPTPKAWRQAEKSLSAYPINILRLHKAIQELRDLRSETDCHAQRYEQSLNSDGQHSDPVAAYHSRITQLEERVQLLIMRTAPVSTVRGDIKNSHDEREREMFAVMELYYFEHMTLEEVAFHLQKSVSTLTRRRTDLVCRVAAEILDNEGVYPQNV